MDIKDLKLLVTPEGRELLAKYQDFNEEELISLLFKVPPSKREMMRSVVSLIKLRQKMADKFSLAPKMFFTPYGGEQSTGEEVARQIASRFEKYEKIADLTCSLGGNLVFLAMGSFVTAIDRNPANLFCAQQNAIVYGVNKQVKFIEGDAFDYTKLPVEAFFFDPERARAGKTKTRSLFNSSPDVSRLLPLLLENTKNIGIKISPAFDYEEIATLPEKPEVEVISENNVCKVAMLWFGDLKTASRRATMLIKGKVYTMDSNLEVEAAPISPGIKNYLYEPNKAIVKAHLIDEAANQFSLFKLDPKIAYLTSDELIKDRTLFRTLKVISSGNYSLQAAKEALRAVSPDDFLRANIITRGFPVKIEDLYKKMKIKEGGDMVVVFTTLNNRRYYIITRLVIDK